MIAFCNRFLNVLPRFIYTDYKELVMNNLECNAREMEMQGAASEQSGVSFFYNDWSKMHRTTTIMVSLAKTRHFTNRGKYVRERKEVLRGRRKDQMYLLFLLLEKERPGGN